MQMRLRDRLSAAVRDGLLADCRCLAPFSALWRGAASLRHALYDLGAMRTHRLGIPVVSIGNIVAGGSGKTPLVHLLARTLQSRGKVAILSRGYLAAQSGLSLGDEGEMLRRKLPEALVFAQKNRVQAGLEAIAQGANAIVLDDGLQYRRLHRDFEIIAIDSANPFGFGAFLPRGLLRDSPKRLGKADAIVVSGEITENLEREIRRYTRAPLIGVRAIPRRTLDLSQREQSLGLGSKIGLFCGLGAPKKFLHTAQSLGLEIAASWYLPDHARPDLEGLAEFSRKAQILGAQALLCTEKDAIKLFESPSVYLPILYLEVELEIFSGKADWLNMIEKIALKMNN